MIIHASNITTYQRCKRKWFYTDRNSGLGYVPRTENEAMTIGTWFHDAMYYHYTNGWPFSDGLEAARLATTKEWARRGQAIHVDWLQQNLIEWTKLTQAMLDGYETWAWAHRNSRYGDGNLNFLATEQEFIVDVTPDITYVGKWDGLARHEDGGLWVFETKTSNNIEQLAAGVEFDWQNKLYIWAAEAALNEPVMGIIYNFVKRTDPTAIPLLKNGLPTKNHVLLKDTTAEIYMTTLLKQTNGEVPKGYHEVFEWLRYKPQEIFARHPVRIPRSHLKRSEEQLISLGNEMITSQEQADEVVPSYNRYDCARYCPFAQVCLAHDDEADWEGALADSFYRQTKEVI